MTSEFSLISFTDTGQIGDTIGGTTAPFLGFFGSILVYLSLKAQIDANEQVRKPPVPHAGSKILSPI